MVVCATRFKYNFKCFDVSRVKRLESSEKFCPCLFCFVICSVLNQMMVFVKMLIVRLLGFHFLDCTIGLFLLSLIALE